MSAVLRWKILWLGRRSIQKVLAADLGWQRTVFDRLAQSFEDRLHSLPVAGLEPFMTPMWQTFERELAGLLLPVPPFNFLSHPTLLETAFVTYRAGWFSEEMAALTSCLPDQTLREVLGEDLVGVPLVIDGEYMTSQKSVHHLYHLCRLIRHHEGKMPAVPRVIEWGGGYGSLAKLFLRLLPQTERYTIVDLPIMSALQWLYLSTVLGEDRVALASTPADLSSSRQVVIVPVTLLGSLGDDYDLFVSTWALSESSEVAQKHVKEKEWFGAKHFLIAYDDDPRGRWPTRFQDQLSGSGCEIEPFGLMPHQYYGLG